MVILLPQLYTTDHYLIIITDGQYFNQVLIIILVHNFPSHSLMHTQPYTAL